MMQFNGFLEDFNIEGILLEGATCLYSACYIRTKLTSWSLGRSKFNSIEPQGPRLHAEYESEVDLT